MTLTRRQFLQSAAVTATATALPAVALELPVAPNPEPVATLGYDEYKAIVYRDLARNFRNAMKAAATVREIAAMEHRPRMMFLPHGSDQEGADG